MKRHINLLLFIFMLSWAATGCVSPMPTPISPLSPLSPMATPSPWPTVIIGGVIIFTDTLTSPSGRVKLPLRCTQCCTDIPHCTATLPNGTTVYEADKSYWSPDERFAVICLKSFHDTPCGWYEVRDMTNGRKIDKFFADSAYVWDPNKEHTLVYLETSHTIGVSGPLVILDSATGEKIFPKICPDWFDQKFQARCHRFQFPYPVIGGQMSGLPNGVRVEIFVHPLESQETTVSYCTYSGSYPWKCPVPVEVFGVIYTVTTTKVAGYISDPISYTIQLSGTKAYVISGGQVTADEATHLDFHFTPVVSP